MGDFIGYKQGHKALFNPGSGPRRVILYVLLVWIDFDGVVTIVEIAIARGFMRRVSTTASLGLI